MVALLYLYYCIQYVCVLLLFKCSCFNNCRIKGEGLASKINLSPHPILLALAAVCSKAVVQLLLIHCLLLLHAHYLQCFSVWSLFCYVVVSVFSRFAICKSAR